MFKNKLLALLLLAGILITLPRCWAEEKTTEDVSAEVVKTYATLVLHEDVDIVYATQMMIFANRAYVDTILKTASLMSNQEERDSIRAWIDTTFEDVDVKQSMYKAFSKPKRATTETQSTLKIKYEPVPDVPSVTEL